MIRAGNYTIDDKGFTTTLENVGGVNRQAIVAELPAGISDEALEALCAGPIEVLDEQGEAVQTHTGPFRLVSHGLKLTRASAEGDVAALTAHVANLEARLETANSEKKSAQDALASLSDQLAELKKRTATTVETPVKGEAVSVDAADSL